MDQDLYTFLQKKNLHLEKLDTASQNDRVDEEILSLLDLLNSFKEYYTTSSCSGRVILLQLPEIGDKKHAEFLGKWHQPFSLREFQHALDEYTQGMLWMYAQSPILHVVCSDLIAAETLIKLAIGSGWKNSCIRMPSQHFVVELASTERIDAPIGRAGIVLLKKSSLEAYHLIAIQLLQRCSQKISRLSKALDHLLQTKDPPKTEITKHSLDK